jgi:hypothetical protein
MSVYFLCKFAILSYSKNNNHFFLNKQYKQNSDWFENILPEFLRVLQMRNLEDWPRARRNRTSTIRNIRSCSSNPDPPILHSNFGFGSNSLRRKLGSKNPLCNPKILPPCFGSESFWRMSGKETFFSFFCRPGIRGFS